MKNKWMVPTLLVLAACARSNAPQEIVVTETYVHKYGVQVPADDWASRGENGQVITTLSTGVKVTKTYSQGILEGDTTYTFPHSDRIQRVESYRQNNLYKVQLNNSVGQPRSETLYHSPTHLSILTWYDNGSPQSAEEYDEGLLVNGEYFTPSHQLESRVDNKEGARIVRDEFRQIVARETIAGGKVSEQVLFYPNQTIKEKVPFHEGKISGLKRTFLPNGEPNTVESWQEGMQEGITTIYQNGEKSAEVPFHKGLKNGIEKQYRNGTDVVAEISWVDGLKHGPSKSYIDGKIVTEWYFKNRSVPRSTFDQMIRPAA